MAKLAIYGAGGFGREVLTLINDINKICNKYDVLGFYDDGHSAGEVINGYKTLGGIDALNSVTESISIVLAVGSPSIKRSILEKIINPYVKFPTLIHPSVMIGDEKYVSIGQGCIICGGTIITTDIIINDFVILNLSCTVGHDTVIGRYSAFMPSVNISGEVQIGEGVYVGTGAKIINQLSIGSDTIIGAGAVVAKDIPSSCTAVGVPAKVIKYH